MTEKKAKKQLAKMLNTLTPGSVLGLLADLFHDAAKQARQAGDRTAAKQARQAAATLVVVGLGIDAIRPRGGTKA